ncbi:MULTISPECIES: alpha/beta fold hydrolase [unclassified Streptomyces]|uniref:alpha/beta fold hydrolase n=1 Tax=unclassified Streptomyces TaxID=2593676 RepID=UPI000DC7E736|nr:MULTISPECIES: alpha/beta fold hydrolase [unclassified Streptomyces]AWZ06635.1 ABC transporter ATP-binding protein [Streptomyces sp. ICC4]AWZ13891.1 ABC transporter ATP-binding protein [Streptomyces sp. ICC1]
MKLRLPRRRRSRLLAGAAALAVVAGAGTLTATAAAGDAPSVRREDRVLEMPGPDVPGVGIDISYFTSGGGGGGSGEKRPAVLLAHGFGGSKDDMRPQAERLARDGYAVLTWSARGFGRSGGKIGLNDPDFEVKDVSRLIDWLAARPEVRLDAAGDPRVGVAGGSYGGAVSLLAAGHDPRVDAIAPSITYWNLADSLFPGGVFKKLWAGLFFTTGSAGGIQPGAQGTADAPGATGAEGATGAPAATGPAQAAPGCGRFQPELCAMYERVAVAGAPDAEARALLERRSPSAVGSAIKVPTLITQGQDDSLFPLDQADAMARAIAANGAPVSVDWAAGGHDGGMREADRVEDRVKSWFDRHLKDDTAVDTGPAFRVSRAGGIDSTDGQVTLRGANGSTYPGLRSGPREFALAGREQTFANPAGGAPPALSALPGIGGQLSALGAGLSLDFPGQNAHFDSEPLTEEVRITGTPTITLKVRSTAADGAAVLFGKVYDVGPDGRRQVLPSQLVAPVRVTDAQQDKTIELRLPAIDHAVEAGHRLRLVVAATDLGYASPAAPASYTVSAQGPLAVPVVDGVRTASSGLPAWTWGMPLGAVLLAAGLVGIRRTGRGRGGIRAGAPQPEPALADVPLEITGLTKRYAKSQDRYAVRDLSFRVEKGQVLGLLGPNGAGKTTTLRMLMGLITPDAGEVRVFGHAVRAGAPVLSRVGAFVEGAGFLPHLTGRANLELYWQATGRPAEDSYMDEALEIAGLGDALERAVRTYSQGMRQRLAIAQAMLGMPDLLILDEPTNGLDPPQIREMRDVMIRYAAGGRTVIVSSHLLSEVEQSCTHLVVMDRGRLVQAGAVAEITGGGDALLVTLAGPVDEVTVGKVTALEGVESVEGVEDGLLVRLDGASAAILIAELVRLEVPVSGVGPHRRLEDAFLTLIGGAA